MRAAQSVSAEVIGGLGEQLVGSGTTAGAGVAALGVHDDGILNHQAFLQHGVQTQSGGGGIAAGVGDEALALGQVALDLGDAVDGLLGHLIVGVLQVIPLLPGLGVPEADVGAEVDELLAGGQNLLGDAAHGAGVNGGEDHVAVLHDHVQSLIIEGEDLLVIEAHQSSVLILDLPAGGEAIGQMGNLCLGMVHHHTQQFTTGIAGSTANRKTNHDTFPPF